MAPDVDGRLVDPSVSSSVVAAGRVFDQTILDPAIPETLFQSRFLDVMFSLLSLNRPSVESAKYEQQRPQTV